MSSKVWKFKRKGRATYSVGKNEMCLVLDLLVDNYAYITGDAELLRLVICTELKIQERNPVPERHSDVGSDTFINNAFHFKKQSNFLVFWLCFKIVQVITSTFKLRPSVMPEVFKMQVVFLETWETAVHGAPAWLRSLRCWTGLSCRLLVRWEAGKKHKKEFMCGWKKDTRGSQTFYLASPVLKERFLSLCPI